MPTVTHPATTHIDASDQTSRIVTADAIRNAVDDYGLPYPTGVQFSPGASGPLAVYVDTDADKAAWLAILGGVPMLGGRPTAVLSVQASRERICGSCGGEFTHRYGCPDEPPVTATPAEVLAHAGDHYGREANHDEAVRLSVVHLGSSGEPFKCGGDSGAFSAYLTEVTCPDCNAVAVIQAAPECPDCGVLNGSHQTWRLGAAAAIPVLVVDVPAVLSVAPPVRPARPRERPACLATPNPCSAFGVAFSADPDAVTCPDCAGALLGDVPTLAEVSGE